MVQPTGMSSFEPSFSSALWRKYHSKLEERIEWRRLPTFVPNKSLPVHSWFYCSQAFSAKLVGSLLDTLEVTQNQKVLDPFCGIGTTLLTCVQRGISSVGCDIFPPFCFVSQVKVRQGYDLPSLKSHIDNIVKAPYHKPKIAAPDHPIFKKAFSPNVLNRILYFKEKIMEIEDEKTRDFLMLGLLSTINEVSYVRKAGAHYRFINVDNIGVRHQYGTKKFCTSNVKVVIRRKLYNMFRDLELVNVGKGPTEAISNVYMGDARKMTFLGNNSIDAVITSPPYLNRDNYVAQYKIELFLLGPPYGAKNFKHYRELAFKTIRSHVEAKEQSEFKLATHIKKLEILEVELSKRKLSYRTIPQMVRGYFEDMNVVFKELHRVIKVGGRGAMVIDNVRFGGLHIPVDFLLSEIAETNGFHIDRIVVARYKMNSPQQMKRYGKMPVRESILLFHK